MMQSAAPAAAARFYNLDAMNGNNSSLLIYDDESRDDDEQGMMLMDQYQAASSCATSAAAAAAALMQGLGANPAAANYSADYPASRSLAQIAASFIDNISQEHHGSLVGIVSNVPRSMGVDLLIHEAAVDDINSGPMNHRYNYVNNNPMIDRSDYNDQLVHNGDPAVQAMIPFDHYDHSNADHAAAAADPLYSSEHSIGGSNGNNMLGVDRINTPSCYRIVNGVNHVILPQQQDQISIPNNLFSHAANYNHSGLAAADQEIIGNNNVMHADGSNIQMLMQRAGGAACSRDHHRWKCGHSKSSSTSASSDHARCDASISDDRAELIMPTILPKLNGSAQRTDVDGDDLLYGDDDGGLDSSEINMEEDVEFAGEIVMRASGE
jgi:hypothetical protein